jgi:predicted nucleic acid-binding protein
MNALISWIKQREIQRANIGIEEIFTMSKVFIDTNILVYSMDNHNKIKKNKCRELLRKAHHDLHGVISTQVIQEFYITATKKLNAEPLIVKDIINSLDRFETVIISPEIIGDAIDCSIISRISFWDALVVSAAQSARCEKIWTEDLNHGQIIRGVLIENPLK